MKTSKVILGSIFSIISLVVAQFVSQLGIVLLNKIEILKEVSPIIGMALYMVLAYYLVKLIVLKYLKVNLKEMGMVPFKLSFRWIIVGIVLPIVILGSYMLLGGEFKLISSNRMPDVVMNIFYGSIAAGFVEELVFRGIILNLFTIRWNKFIGILIPSVLFASLHIIGGRLSFISILQLLVAGTLAGIMFSLIEIDKHNFWNDAFVHGFWNLMTSAFICISVAPSPVSLYTFIPKTSNFLMTGGNFGMESSIISIVGYVIVIMLAIYFRNKKKI